jgi:hypothetical protein
MKRVIEPGEEALTADDHVAVLAEATRRGFEQVAQKMNAMIMAHNVLAAKVEELLQELVRTETVN